MVMCGGGYCSVKSGGELQSAYGWCGLSELNQGDGIANR